MEAELQELKELIQQLRAENEKLRQEQTQAQLAASQPGISSNPIGTAEPTGDAAINVPSSSRSSTQARASYDRLLYVPRERKCPMFRGKGGMGVTEWMEEVRASVRARHLSRIDEAYFIYDHLEGEAKNEIKYRTSAEREDPDKILSILQEVYGCMVYGCYS